MNAAHHLPESVRPDRTPHFAAAHAATNPAAGACAVDCRKGREARMED